MTGLFGTVLVANRGEIAVRISRTLRGLGIRSAVAYVDADRDARHVAEADLAIRVGSYLDVEEVVAAAVAAGAGALHPGYGFLAENPALARACAAAGVTFVGPPIRALEIMADKAAAKATVAAAGVPVVAGTSGDDLADAELVAAARQLGLPVLVKPVAGGGGKGMHRVTEPADLEAAVATARREAAAAFGDGRLMVERLISPARHLEVQVLADTHGRVLALGDRECSLQRRHQKLIEEAPAPGLDPEVRRAMAESAVAAADACGYVGAGTVELLAARDAPGGYAFMEMNTRLQVEHPVTEAVTGIDLVEWQLRVAAGAHLPWDTPPSPRGHAVEARICAEDPDRGFLPATGTVLALREPGDRPHVRVDSGLAPGTVVGAQYDPLLAKVVAWGEDRAQALARLGAALAATTVLGVATNTGFLRRLLDHPAVIAGRADTELVEREAPALRVGPGDELFVAAALVARLAPTAGPAGDRAVRDPWDEGDGWRVGGPVEVVATWMATGRAAPVGLTAAPSGPPAGEATRVWGGSCRVADGPTRPLRATLGPTRLDIELEGRRTSLAWAREGDAVWLGHGGDTWVLHPMRRGAAAPAPVAGSSGPVRSPMPGTVLAVHVGAGQPVRAGQPLVTVEAMKMEHVVTAPVAGRAAEILVREGDAVALDQPLVVVAADAGAPGAATTEDRTATEEEAHDRHPS